MSEQCTTIHLPFHTTAVLFDLDNTLYSREQAFQRWALAFIHTHLAPANQEEAQKLLNHLITLDGYGMTARELFFAQLCETYPTISTPVVQLVMRYRQELAQHIIPDEGMDTLLAALKAAGIPFGIVTNGTTQNQQRKIAQLKLDQLTSCIFISHAFGVKKPHPSIFLAAARALNVKPEQILFVGDHPHLDISGAHAVGMRTVWLQQSLPWPDDLSPEIAGFTVHSLRELYELFCV